MRFTKLFVIVALLGLSTNEIGAVRLHDFNGADEDEIMDKVFSKYSVEGRDHNDVKNGSRILMKATAPKAAGVILEATHKLKGSQVPGYLKANFEKAWNRFDINADGFIRAEETHTFTRSLMGKLNKFALAPGSLSDIGGAPSAATNLSEAVSAPAPKAAAPKKASTPDDDAAADNANVEVDVS